VLPPPKSQAVADDKGKEAPERACVAPAWPPIRPAYPLPPYTIALVERGGCDFATKVLAAQERGAAAVIVGDSVAHPGETDEEGRARENLITMFSPGELLLAESARSGPPLLAPVASHALLLL
jgi:hypothetical protein